MKLTYTILIFLFLFRLGPAHAQSKLNNNMQFRQWLSLFKAAAKQNEFKKLQTLLNYPFYTSVEGLGERNGKPLDPITTGEFSSYQQQIFPIDVKRLLPKTTEEDLSEIDPKTPESYYKVLYKLCDAGSPLYELYVQYPTANGSESYFAFVFGKVKGKYKAIAYYGKWPVK